MFNRLTGRSFISVLLFLAVFGVSCKAGTFLFVHYDNQLYVGENVHLREGLTAVNARRALMRCGYASSIGFGRRVTHGFACLRVALRFRLKRGVSRSVNAV